MNNVQRFKRCFWAVLAIAVIVSWCPNQSRAESKPITAEELKYSGPFEINSRIMEIDYAKNMLIVAEYTIYAVDLMVGAEHLLTVLSDEEGEAVAFETLARGQRVLVRGLQLPDGRVIAELIQTAGEQARTGRMNNRRPAILQVNEIKPIN
jgi:hypothetical protein